MISIEESVDSLPDRTNTGIWSSHETESQKHL